MLVNIINHKTCKLIQYFLGMGYVLWVQVIFGCIKQVLLLFCVKEGKTEETFFIILYFLTNNIDKSQELAEKISVLREKY